MRQRTPQPERRSRAAERVANFVVLIDALEKGKPTKIAEAQRELERLGVLVRVLDGGEAVPGAK